MITTKLGTIRSSGITVGDCKILVNPDTVATHVNIADGILNVYCQLADDGSPERIILSRDNIQNMLQTIQSKKFNIIGTTEIGTMVVVCDTNATYHLMDLGYYDGALTMDIEHVYKNKFSVMPTFATTSPLWGEKTCTSFGYGFIANEGIYGVFESSGTVVIECVGVLNTPYTNEANEISDEESVWYDD